MIAFSGQNMLKTCSNHNKKILVLIDSFILLKFLYYLNGMYEGNLESKERFAIKKYLLIIGKKKNMQILSHTFTYFST